jgi:hypothetical protein
VYQFEKLRFLGGSWHNLSLPDQSRKKPKRPRDLNLLSKIVEIATEGEPAEEPSEKTPHLSPWLNWASKPTSEQRSEFPAKLLRPGGRRKKSLNPYLFHNKYKLTILIIL